MRIKWGALLLAMAMMLGLLTACGEQDPEKIAATVVAEVNGQPITKGEAEKVSKWYEAQTVTMYAQQGQAIDTTDASFISHVKTTTLSLMTHYEALEQRLASMGHSLTDADWETIRSDAQSEYDLTVESLIANNGVTEDEAKEHVEALGYSLDAFEYMLYVQTIDDRVREYGLDDVAVTEEEAKAEYDARVEDAQTRYAADASAFIQDSVDEKPIYVYPEGFRYVKNLVVPMPDEIRQQLTEKQQELYTAMLAQATAQNELDNATDLTDERKAELEASITTYTEDYTRLNDEYNALNAQGQEESKPLADTIYDEAISGKSFDELMSEYNTDQPPAIALEKGYPVGEGITYYVQEFTDAALALENIGDISAPFTTTYGYHILLYTGDVTPGVTPFEEVKDALTEEMLDAKKEETVQTRMTEWVEEANIKTYINKF